MRIARPFVSLLVILPLAGLSACGGGSGGSSGGADAALTGVLETRDGTTENLAGVRLRMLETGEVATTRADGGFEFSRLPTGTVAIQVVSVPRASGPGSGGDGSDDGGSGSGGSGSSGPGSDPEDDFEDDDGGPHHGSGGDGDPDDVGDDDFDLDDIVEGESIRVRIRVVGNTIVSLEVKRSNQERLRVDLRLVRAAGSDDADVQGHVRLESRDDRERFQAEAEQLAPGRRVELFVIDDAGIAESQGVRTVDTVGEAEWNLDDRDGERLPFGVAAVADLEGFDVEVRDADSGLVLLVGSLPEMPDVGGGAPGGDDDEQRGRARLANAPGVAGDAFVEVEREPEDGGVEDEIEFELEHLTFAPGTSLQVFLEDAGGTLVLVATLAVDATGRARVEFETDDGGSLPTGATSVDDLVGRDVEIRRASDGSVLFSGQVPPLV